MEGLAPRLTQIRWRRRGAWMWPSFPALTAADVWIGHSLPSSGDVTTVGDAMVTALALNLLIVAFACRPVGAALRRARPDLPAIVARDYAGTGLMLLLSATLLVTGIAHRSTITMHHAMMRDAIARAQAWIGARAPAEFRRHLDAADTVTIEPGIYRTCVPGTPASRDYCVIVKTALPLARSVVFDGYESNRTFMWGADA